MAVTDFGGGGYSRNDTGNPSGTVMGIASTDKIGFYGAVPVIQASAITTVTTTALVAASTSYGFTTTTQAAALITAVNSLIAALGSSAGVGLIA